MDKSAKADVVSKLYEMLKSIDMFKPELQDVIINLTKTVEHSLTDESLEQSRDISAGNTMFGKVVDWLSISLNRGQYDAASCAAKVLQKAIKLYSISCNSSEAKANEYADEYERVLKFGMSLMAEQNKLFCAYTDLAALKSDKLFCERQLVEKGNQLKKLQDDDPASAYFVDRYSSDFEHDFSDMEGAQKIIQKLAEIKGTEDILETYATLLEQTENDTRKIQAKVDRLIRQMEGSDNELTLDAEESCNDNWYAPYFDSESKSNSILDMTSDILERTNDIASWFNAMIGGEIQSDLRYIQCTNNCQKREILKTLGYSEPKDEYVPVFISDLECSFSSFDDATTHIYDVSDNEDLNIRLVEKPKSTSGYQERIIDSIRAAQVSLENEMLIESDDTSEGDSLLYQFVTELKKAITFAEVEFVEEVQGIGVNPVTFALRTIRKALDIRICIAHCSESLRERTIECYERLLNRALIVIRSQNCLYDIYSNIVAWKFIANVADSRLSDAEDKVKHLRDTNPKAARFLDEYDISKKLSDCDGAQELADAYQNYKTSKHFHDGYRMLCGIFESIALDFQIMLTEQMGIAYTKEVSLTNNQAAKMQYKLRNAKKQLRELEKSNADLLLKNPKIKDDAGDFVELWLDERDSILISFTNSTPYYDPSKQFDELLDIKDLKVTFTDLPTDTDISRSNKTPTSVNSIVNKLNNVLDNLGSLKSDSQAQILRIIKAAENELKSGQATTSCDVSAGDELLGDVADQLVEALRRKDQSATSSALKVMQKAVNIRKDIQSCSEKTADEMVADYERVLDCGLIIMCIYEMLYETHTEIDSLSECKASLETKLADDRKKVQTLVDKCPEAADFLSKLTPDGSQKLSDCEGAQELSDAYNDFKETEMCLEDATITINEYNDFARKLQVTIDEGMRIINTKNTALTAEETTKLDTLLKEAEATLDNKQTK